VWGQGRTSQRRSSKYLQTPCSASGEGRRTDSNEDGEVAYLTIDSNRAASKLPLRLSRP
jgi:hypothetical protein